MINASNIDFELKNVQDQYKLRKSLVIPLHRITKTVIRYGSTALLIAFGTAAGILTDKYLTIECSFMIYFAASYYCAYKFGSGPALLACILSVLSFDYFFELPYFQFRLLDWNDLFMFMIMFLIIAATSKRTAALEKHATELEKNVFIRTKELTQSNELLKEEVQKHQETESTLRQTIGELAKSNAALQQFARIASHDLQEPLRVIQGYVDLLVSRYKGQLDSDADEFFAYIEDASKRMENLIKGVLAHASICAQSKIFEKVDTSQSLKDACANLQQVITERGALITQSSLPTVTANSVQITQLFQNLIGNAIKFQKNQAPQIHISAEQKDNAWLFSVADNGIGMEKQYLDRIFGMFKRLHSSREYPGTGLGLAICKAIVDQHKGKIWVTSVPGAGSTFYFTIPITD